MLKVLAIVAVLSAAAVPAAMSKPPQGTPAANHGCDKSYTYKAAKRGLRKALKHHYPMSQAMGANAWKYVLCTRSRDATRKLRARRTAWKKWRSSYEHVWPIRFHALAATWQDWAVRTSTCEAHMDPTTGKPGSATDNAFEGAFQFLPSTWASAGGTGHAYDHSWHYQAVIAVHWRWRSSQAQWPNCAPW